MCTLTKSMRKKKAKGWKVVAVDKEGDYYSPALGFKYDKPSMTMPKKPSIKNTKRVTNHFRNPRDILSISYQYNMVSRTAIFTKKRDANSLCSIAYEMGIKGFRFKVVKAKISGELMKGFYSIYALYCPVMAGNTITFLE